MNSPMRYFRVRNWERFQHYKDRGPVWIKLYTGLVDNFEFQQLSDEKKWHLIGIWIVCSKFFNKVPWDAKWIKREIRASKRVNLEELQTLGFIEEWEDDSNTLAECSGSAIPEKEVYKEREDNPPLPPLSEKKGGRSQKKGNGTAASRMSDDELLKEAQALTVSTYGKNRDQLVRDIETKRRKEAT